MHEIKFNGLVFVSTAIHVDFSPPTGKLVYEVVEGAGSLEVCLVLANVGSFNKNSTLNTPVTVHLTTIQTDQTLYKPGEFDSSIRLCIYYDNFNCISFESILASFYVHVSVMLLVYSIASNCIPYHSSWHMHWL